MRIVVPLFSQRMEGDYAQSGASLLLRFVGETMRRVVHLSVPPGVVCAPQCTSGCGMCTSVYLRVYTGWCMLGIHRVVHAGYTPWWVCQPSTVVGMPA